MTDGQTQTSKTFRSDAELLEMHGIINSLWQMIKKYHNGNMDDNEYWKEMCMDGKTLAAKHGNHRLAQLMVNAYLQYMEEQEGRKQ